MLNDISELTLYEAQHRAKITAAFINTFTFSTTSFQKGAGEHCLW